MSPAVKIGYLPSPISAELDSASRERLWKTGGGLDAANSSYRQHNQICFLVLVYLCTGV